MSNEAELSRVVYTTNNYEVRITTIADPESGKPLDVYGIFNREFDVREAELRGYPHAITWCDKLQGELEKIFTERAAADAARAQIEAALGPDNSQSPAQDEGDEQTPDPNPVPSTKEEANALLEAAMESVTPEPSAEAVEPREPEQEQE